GLCPGIYAGRRRNASAVEEFLAHRGVRQLAFKEGWNATISVWESGPGRTLKVNGKADASDHGDMDTEILLGLAPAAARPGAARALVIGYGSGVTTRVLAGVFCQWVQLYQVPLSVVAGIVRNVNAVFPHVEIWFSSPGDVMVLGSGRPLAYDPAWLARLVGPHGALGELGREYLGVDQPADYFGHLLPGPTGAAELLKRPSVAHRDDLPRLEFVAARRFLDSRGTEGVFDSLVGMRAATQAADGASPFLFAKALTVRRGDPAALRYIDAARRARPGEPLWTVHAAALPLGL